MAGVLTMLAGHASYAAQAVAHGPRTPAPPSFNGHGWLVVLNLSWMTCTALTALMVCTKIATDLIENGIAGWYGKPTKGPLVALLRVIVLIAFGGMALRTGAEAMTLWGWDPYDPVATGWYLTAKRMVDPFGAAAYWSSMCLFVMTQDALEGSLERQPFPKRMIAELPKLKRPFYLAVLTFVAAIGVVSTR